MIFKLLATIKSMKRLVPWTASVVMAILTIGGIAYAQTIPSISPFQYDSSGNITQRIANNAIKLTGITTGTCLTLNSSHILTTTTCGSGGSGTGVATTSLTATSPLSVTKTSASIDYGVASGYSIPLTASTTDWQSFYTTPSTRITAGSNCSWTGNTFNCVGGGAGGGLASTSPWTIGELVMAASQSAVKTVATSSLNLTTSSFASPDISQWTNNSGYLTSVAPDWPLSGLGTSGSHLHWSGIATTSPFVSGHLLYASGVNGIANVATSTVTATSPLTGSFTVVGTGGSIGCQTASGSQAGCLSSADWTTFNNKQGAITLTTSGTSGAATFSGGTLNIPQYAGTTYTAGNGLSLSAGAFSINDAYANTFTAKQTFGNASSTLFSTSYASSTSYYGAGLASCNTSTSALTWSGGKYGCHTITPGTGTVTSVAMSVPTGLSISGSPITTSGTLALTYASGYAGVLTASTTNWNNFYNTPSTRITAGTGLSWSGNTLNASGGSGVWPFTPTTNYGVAVQSTTTPEWFKNGMMASSTSRFANASTTLFTTGNLYDTALRTTGEIPFTTGSSGFLTGNAGLTGGTNFLQISNQSTGVSYINLNSIGESSHAQWQFSTGDSNAGNLGDLLLSNQFGPTNIVDFSYGGNVGIGSTTPGSILSVGTTGGINFNANATSTFAKGINLKGGCFAVKGTCITGTGGSGTVTSVGMTVPTGLTVSGSPITTSGTLALSLQSGYNIPLTASTTDWNTAYLDRITSATAPLGITSNALSFDFTHANSWTGLQTFTNTGTTSFSGGISTAKTIDVQSTTATSTFANGIKLLHGCFLLPSGSCAGTGGGGGTPGGSNMQLQYNNSGAFGGAAQLVWNATKKILGLGTTTPWLDNSLSLGSTTAVLAATYKVTASTAITLGMASSSNVEIDSIGTSAYTITYSKYDLAPGQKQTLVTCNGASTAGALTFANVHYSGGVQPGNTTTANQCDMWYLETIAGTSTPIIVLTGMTSGIE